MKTIKLQNGEIRKGYDIDELCEEARNKAINDTINFEIEVMDEDSPYYHCAEEMERMQTPWFLGEKIWSDHKVDIIETIKLNWLFDEDGEILPLNTYTGKNNEVIKYTFGRKEVLCTVE